MGRGGIGAGIGGAEAGFHGLDEDFESLDALDQNFNSGGESGEEVGWGGFAQGVEVDIGGVHRSAAGEHPVAVDAEGSAEGGEELGAGGLAGHVAPDGFGVDGGELAYVAVRAIANDGDDAFVQGAQHRGVEGGIAHGERAYRRGVNERVGEHLETGWFYVGMQQACVMGVGERTDLCFIWYSRHGHGLQGAIMWPWEVEPSPAPPPQRQPGHPLDSLRAAVEGDR